MSRSLLQFGPSGWSGRGQGGEADWSVFLLHSRGLWPNLLKVAPSIATSFWVYESVKEKIEDHYEKKREAQWATGWKGERCQRKALHGQWIKKE